VLLGTILSSALVARGRFQRQLRDADDKIAAVRAADALVSRWIALPAGTVPVPGEGAVSHASELTWRTNWVSDPYAQRLGARKARLDVFNDRAAAQPPLVSIEFLLQRPPRPAPATREVQP
jgi:hypothetical protein